MTRKSVTKKSVLDLQLPSGKNGFWKPCLLRHPLFAFGRDDLGFAALVGDKADLAVGLEDGPLDLVDLREARLVHLCVDLAARDAHAVHVIGQKLPLNLQGGTALNPRFEQMVFVGKEPRS